MTRDKLDLLYKHCADLDVMVEWRPRSQMKPGRRGEYQHRRDLIVLGTHLIRRQAIATLAHECGHQRFGDTCSNPTNERRAWEYGAALIITPAEYQAAEWEVGPSPQALAIELDVTPKLIEAWRRWWLTRGQFLANDLAELEHGSDLL